MQEAIDGPQTETADTLCHCGCGCAAATAAKESEAPIQEFCECGCGCHASLLSTASTRCGCGS